MKEWVLIIMLMQPGPLPEEDWASPMLVCTKNFDECIYEKVEDCIEAAKFVLSTVTRKDLIHVICAPFE